MQSQFSRNHSKQDHTGMTSDFQCSYYLSKLWRYPIHYSGPQFSKNDSKQDHTEKTPAFQCRYYLSKLWRHPIHYSGPPQACFIWRIWQMLFQISIAAISSKNSDLIRARPCPMWQTMSLHSRCYSLNLKVTFDQAAWVLPGRLQTFYEDKVHM